MDILQELLTKAENKPGFTAVHETHETMRRIMPQAQQELRRLSLRTLQIRDVLNESVDPVLPKPGNPGIHSRVAANIVAANSKCVAAGANIVLIQDAAQPRQDSSGQIYMLSQPGGFIVAENAQFNLIADGANVTESDLPIFRAMMDRSIAPTYAFNVVLTRRQQKSFFDGELEEALMIAIMQGLGKVVDTILLEAILLAGPLVEEEAGPPTSFSIAKAAERGLNIGSLRALIGTSGTGAAFNGAGKLVANNIEAKLTDCIAQTCIGDFSRSAVGLMEDITLIANRSNAFEGEMSVSCIANAEALLPVTGDILPFWLGV